MKNFAMALAAAALAASPMVVVPTANEVRMTYGRSGSDLLYYMMTLAGIALMIYLRVRGDADLEPGPSTAPVVAGGPSDDVWAGSGRGSDGDRELELLDEESLDDDSLLEDSLLDDEPLDELDDDGSDELLLEEDDEDELEDELELLLDELEELLSHGSQHSSRSHDPRSIRVALWTVTGRFISRFSPRHSTS